MTIHKKTDARRASQAERDCVRELIDLYRQAEQCPGQRYCLNESDEPELQTFIDFNDTNYLLGRLEHFVATGLFQDTDNFDDLCIRAELESLNNERRYSKKTAIHKVADMYEKKYKTVERYASGIKWEKPVNAAPPVSVDTAPKVRKTTGQRVMRPRKPASKSDKL
jgi:hypothetical protein